MDEADLMNFFNIIAFFACQQNDIQNAEFTKFTVNLSKTFNEECKQMRHVCCTNFKNYIFKTIKDVCKIQAEMNEVYAKGQCIDTEMIENCTQ